MISKKTSTFFESIVEILRHIKDVEQEVVLHSKNSMLNVSRFIEEKNIQPNEKVLEAMQYQDILSQQLSATSKTIDEICTTINRYQRSIEEDSNIMENSFEKLETQLRNSLKNARNYKESFNGKMGSEDSSDEIEFF